MRKHCLGGSLYGPGGSHGEPGATVTIDPAVPTESGPIYFNLAENNICLVSSRLKRLNH